MFDPVTSLDFFYDSKLQTWCVIETGTDDFVNLDAIPWYCKQRYQIPGDHEDGVIDGLFERLGSLEEKMIIPSPNNYDNIFPKLSDLMKIDSEEA
jgi:hypothetical protein